MDSPMKDKRLQALNTHWGNHSRSSINSASDVGTFHSATDNHNNRNSQHMELHPLNTQNFMSPSLQVLPSPTLEALKMARKDSGYSETPTLHNSGPSSRRTSTSTSTSRRASPSKSRRRSHQSNNSYSTRPSTRRASKSSPQTAQIQPLSSFSANRPGLNSRNTIHYPSTPPNNTTTQFFHFPSFPTPDSTPPSQAQPPIPPPQQPPPTIQYWTSEETRRLEYAAIDAASRGIRGFVTRLVPDCMLPKEFRRTKFCQGDEGSEAGSVRRYRLDLPKEDNKEKKPEQTQRAGLFRRLSGGFRR